MSTANNLAGFLQVYAEQSLQQFIAEMPPVDLFTADFSPTIANGGTAFTTRIATTNWSTPNNLATGWASTAASASAVTGTLKIRDYDVAFNELEWPTLTPQVLTNTFFPQMAKQLANGIIVDCYNNITSSVFTNTVTVNSSSLFTVTGSTSSLQLVSQTLDNNEIPFNDRFLIVTPNLYTGLVATTLPTYYYGSDVAVQRNKVQELLGFKLHRHPRLYGASKPQGGSSYSAGDKLVGFAGNKEGLVLAVRAPMEINDGVTYSATAVDESSGLSLQLRYVYDQSQPVFRLAVVSIFGSAAGNPSAIVPIITLTN